MARQAMITMERVGREVHVRFVVIPDSLEDADADTSGPGIGFSRKEALDLAWRLLRVTLLP